jgi:hypothetical protein
MYGGPEIIYREKIRIERVRKQDRGNHDEQNSVCGVHVFPEKSQEPEAYS